MKSTRFAHFQFQGVEKQTAETASRNYIHKTVLGNHGSVSFATDNEQHVSSGDANSEVSDQIYSSDNSLSGCNESRRVSQEQKCIL